MDSLIRMIVSSIIRGSIYRLLWRRSNGVIIGVAAVALLIYVWNQS